MASARREAPSPRPTKAKPKPDAASPKTNAKNSNAKNSNAKNSNAKNSNAASKRSPKTPRRASTATSTTRTPLTRERALDVALAIADAGGLAELSMRRLAHELGVEAMSLYHHVASKDAILSGMVDRVFTEIELPDPELDWKTALRRRSESMRRALLRHRWALGVMESRTTPGIATVAHHDAVLGCLRRGGFSVPLAAHAYAVLDAFVYGFAHTEITLPFTEPDEAHAVAASILDQLPPGAFPHLVELTREHVLKPGYSYSAEFEFGLELILEGLERRRA